MNEINFVELKNIYECVNLLLDYYGNQNIINVGDKNIADKYNGFVDFSLEGNHFICDVLLYMNLKE